MRSTRDTFRGRADAQLETCNVKLETNRGQRAGFTLVELLIVMAILAILGGLVTAAAQTARKRGAVTKAKAAIAAVETALQMYQLDLGGYPASGNASLVTALTTSSGSSDWHGPYMEFKQEELTDGRFLDPWGKPYVYTAPGVHRTASYDLYSTGPNGTAGDGDDIVNW